MTNQSLESMLQEAEREPFRYMPISAKKKYKRKVFVDAHEELNDLHKYAQAIEKDPYNLGAREDLSGLLFGDPTWHNGVSADAIRKYADAAFSDGLENMARYAKKNEDKFFELLDGDSLMDLVLKLPLYKTGKKEYDDLRAVINHVGEMSRVAEEGNINEIAKIVREKAESKSVPVWAKELCAYYSTDKEFVAKVFNRSYAAKRRALGMALSKDDKPNEKLLRDMVKESIRVAEREYDDETDKKKKKEIWEHCIRPYYAMIAGTAYEIEKKAQDKENEENNDNLKKKNERKAHRKSLGMAK